MAQGQSGSFVTVACKLPSGLRLRVFDMVETTEPTMNGPSRIVKVAHEIGEQVVLNGNSIHEGMSPQGYQIYGGYALTPNVPKEFFDTWLVQNKDSDLVKNGLIFAHSSESNARAESLEKASKRSGFERMNPDKLPQEFTKGPIQIHTGDTKPN